MSAWIEEEAQRIEQARTIEAWKAERSRTVEQYTASLWNQLAYSIKQSVAKINNTPTLREATGGLRLSELSTAEIEVRRERSMSARLNVTLFSQSFEIERRARCGPLSPLFLLTLSPNHGRRPIYGRELGGSGQTETYPVGHP